MEVHPPRGPMHTRSTPMSALWRALLVLALSALLAVPVAAARGITPPEEIEAAALAALGLQGTRSEARVDRALRLDACGVPLSAWASGPRTVQVACGDDPGWRVYVPVRISREAAVAVLTRPVAAGEPIGADDVAIRTRGIGAAAAGTLVDPEQVVGQTATRALAPGAVLAEADLARGPLLQRGDPVVLVSRSGGIEVRMQGRATRWRWRTSARAGSCGAGWPGTGWWRCCAEPERPGR